MKTWLVLLFVFILSDAEFLLAGVVMKLVESDSGRTMMQSVNDVLEILLPGNITMGYVWEASSLDAAVLKLDKTNFISNDKTMCSGGIEVIKLHANGEGISEVRFIYYRPFENG